MPDSERTPEQIARSKAKEPGNWPGELGPPYHRHFANDAVHRDGGPECDQPGTPRRVYVFDPDYLSEHEAFITRRTAEQGEITFEGHCWYTIVRQGGRFLRAFAGGREFSGLGEFEDEAEFERWRAGNG